jgi:vancomycin resistance protein VanJ
LNDRLMGRAVASQPPSRARIAKWVTCGSWTHLALIGGVVLLLQVVSERWWLGTVLTYLPRSPWLIPALIMIPVSIRWAWKSSLINLAALLLVLGPVMNFQSGGLFDAPDIDRTAYRLTVVSCNVQSFRPDFRQVVHELYRIDPDVVLFQEAFEGHPLVETFFAGWNLQRVDEYLVASKLPIKFIDTGFMSGFDRVSVAHFEVETPQGVIAIFNVHQTSPRHSLKELKPWSLLTGTGVDAVEQQAALRDSEAMKTRAYTELKDPIQPKIVAGDFNMPNDSSLFKSHWSGLTDAYASVATGYGYTSPCDTQKLWPSNTPWSQVDHILTSDHWQVERCWIGHSGGSDHRLIAAQLRLPKRTSNGK